MSFQQFQEWQEFYKMDYFGSANSEMRNARLLALIANVNRDPKKKPSAYSEKDFFIYPELLPKPDGKGFFRELKSWAVQYNAMRNKNK
jgi:hypothetical protein